MDAKPQRPLRALQIRDENAPPLGLAGKSIHQRNKSSPALSSLAGAGALKPGSKRAVFADLSNTARGIARDDSVLSSKTVLEPLKEVSAYQENTKQAPLQRPAQRPLSVSAIKGLLTSLASTSLSASSKPAALQTQSDQATQIANARKPLIRKSTTVFKESSLATIEHLPLPAAQPPSSVSEAALPPFSHYPGPFEPLVKTNGQIRATTLTDSVISQYDQGYQVLEPVDSISSPEIQARNYAVDQSAGYVPQKSEYHQTSDGIEVFEDAQLHMFTDVNPNIDPRLVHPGELVEGVIEPENCAPFNDMTPELNENWEEEAYDDQYEDDGYTTARSFKSKGDYTTGPTTVVLAPKVTAKVEKELAEAWQYVQRTKTADDIDEEECWDTSMVAEYGDEIFAYMRRLEERMRPNPYYMDNQTEVQWSMRSVLMDWLVQVHHRFSLLPETLFLCVNYIDRFLSCKVVSLGKLQLVGATAIFVAAKYEEINCPSIQEIVYMVDGGYTVDEILKAERFMLTMLQFELGWPGPMSFLRRISKADDYDLETRTLAKYFLEITIMDERFVGCIPSYTAAGAHCLARLMLKKLPWSPAHVYYSNYTYSQLRPLLVALISCCEDPQRHHGAIYEKYCNKQFKKASIFVREEIQAGFALPSTTRHSMQRCDNYGGWILNKWNLT